MVKQVLDEMRHPDTPKEVEIRAEAPPPVADGTFGIPVELDVRDGPAPVNRLVTIGDSLTHGFKSFAVSDTELSYPAMIAGALGWGSTFRFATYPGPGGLPLSLEWLLRGLERKYGETLDSGEYFDTLREARRLLEMHEDYWERGAGSEVPKRPHINHNLAVYGWDLRDALSLNADKCRKAMKRAWDIPFWPGRAQNAEELAALRVLDSARDSYGRALTQFEAAEQLGAEAEPGADGIETLIVFLGANNALPTVLMLDAAWSGDDYAHMEKKSKYTVWNPEHFRAELRDVVAAVARIRARHVLWLTIPHVTIAPIARGVGGKVRGESRYFRYYTRPWVKEEAFLANPKRYPHLDHRQVRAIDSAIDQYNEAICAAVCAARRGGADWRVVDIRSVFDRVAVRRNDLDPIRGSAVAESPARPEWWTPYDFPEALLDAHGNPPTPLFLLSGPNGVTQGGLASMDGVHPTTVGYSIIARECMKTMVSAGVEFTSPELDFAAVKQSDSLLSTHLRSLGSTVDLLGDLDDRFAIIARAERALRRKKQVTRA